MACILTSIIKCWLEKIWVCTSRNSTHKAGRNAGHTVLGKLYFITESATSQHIPFILSYLKIPFSAVKRLNSFAWNLHLEMTCLFHRLLSFCFHIPFSPSVTKPGSISICNWQTSVNVQRSLSREGLSLPCAGPQDHGAFVHQKNTAMKIPLFIPLLDAHL